MRYRAHFSIFPLRLNRPSIFFVYIGRDNLLHQRANILHLVAGRVLQFFQLDEKLVLVKLNGLSDMDQLIGRIL